MSGPDIALPARTSNGMLAMLDGIRDSLPPLTPHRVADAAPADRLEADDPQAVAARSAIVDTDTAGGDGDGVQHRWTESERRAFLRRVQSVDPRERRA